VIHKDGQFSLYRNANGTLSYADSADVVVRDDRELRADGAERVVRTWR
jgi:hypothetical protein